MLRLRRRWVLSWLTAALVLLALAGTLLFRTQAASLKLDTVAVRNGDILFLHGRSPRAVVVRLLAAGPDYSHAGILVAGESGLDLIHANPGRNGTGGVVREHLGSFLTSGRVSGGAVFRLRDDASTSTAAGSASAAARAFWEQRLPFDNEFDLATPQALYCTELVWRACLNAGVDLRDGPMRGKARLMPGDLARSGLLVPVCLLSEDSPGR